MEKAIQAAGKPRTVEEFKKALVSGGIDVASYRDAWNRPYRLVSSALSKYGVRTDLKTVRVFGGAAKPKTDIVPVTQQFITFALRSAGPDGIEDTEDDFDVARFPILLSEESAPEALGTKEQAGGVPHGTGTISGFVTDPSGAAIPSVTVTLIDATGRSNSAATNNWGIFHFRSVPAGIYSLEVSAPGFTKYIISEVPVSEGRTSTVELAMQVGSVSESVLVEAQSPTINTQNAQVSQSAEVSATPRVREYFPETLLWLPEVITDSRGIAHAQLDFADSVTTWKVAVIASTMDGRMAEAESDVRTFQPLFLDFNPPAVLTEGDKIELPVAVRNYQDHEQKADVTLQPNDWSIAQGSATQGLMVPANSSVNATYVVQAKKMSDKAKQRITVGAGSNVSTGSNNDAIEKSLRVHPDGQEIVQSSGDFVLGDTAFVVTIPANAKPNSVRGELRLYPNVASLLLESASAILIAPHGCAEQTISAGYANLVAWRFARAAGIIDPRIEKRAMTNVHIAVERLKAFQHSGGGISYWGAGEADIAVSAYALSFLIEAEPMAAMDRDDIQALASWLENRQQKDGTWISAAGNAALKERQTLLLTGVVMKALAAAKKAGLKIRAASLSGAYHHVARFIDSTDEPYMLAQFILAAIDSGDESVLGDAVARLTALGRDERGGVYWDLKTNTPFYGWGTAGRYETTGLVVSALSAWRAAHPDSAGVEGPIRRGVAFLLRGRDATGGWYSTQSTVRAMRALADASVALGGFGGTGGTMDVRSNGRLIKVVAMPGDPKATDPITVDLSAFLPAGENRIALTPSAGMQAAMMRYSTTHWVPWEPAKVRTSAELRLAVQFDRLESRAGELVRCTAKAERVGFRGYGMMLAEIGLPPGAEVDRASLESIIDESNGVDHYEILPDRVVLYLWPAAGGSSFEFLVSARVPMVAKSGPSILYDYYNPEAMAEVPPVLWTVK